MIEVVVDSIRVSLMSQHRLVVLKELHAERYLPIWIGTFEADAITVELQETPPPRPLTHDLLKATIEQMGGQIKHILINDLRNNVYYARIVIEHNGDMVEVDARSSDAIAVAIRGKSPIFVNETVMERAAIEPDEEIEGFLENELSEADAADFLGEFADEPPTEAAKVDESKLSAFADFLDTLDIDDLDESDE